MLTRSITQVARRRVFYIPGYDPNPPRRYRELYRSESAAQAKVSAYRIDQKPLAGETGWLTRARIEGGEVVTRFDVMVWDDLVRGSMRAGIAGTYAAMIRTAWIYLSTGTFRRLSWLAKGPVLAALYPIAMLVAQAMAAIIGASILGSLAAWAMATITSLAVGLFSAATWPALMVAAITFWVIFLPVTVLALRWFKAKDDRLYAHYLMHDFDFWASRKGAYPKAVEDRLHEFRAQIASAMSDEVDEILIVGHSSGATLAVSILADMVRLGQVRLDGPEVSLLTLGQVIPMQSFLPKADRLRRDLALLAVEDKITWVDVSAPGDGCCFALSDPVSVSGVAPAKGQRWPLVLSAAFTKTLSREKQEALRGQWFRLHFQYLCAFDRPGEYDYFRITAGPKTLAQRFRGRRPSASRIDVAASAFTSVMA